MVWPSDKTINKAWFPGVVLEFSLIEMVCCILFPSKQLPVFAEPQLVLDSVLGSNSYGLRALSWAAKVLVRYISLGG